MLDFLIGKKDFFFKLNKRHERESVELLLLSTVGILKGEQVIPCKEREIPD